MIDIAILDGQRMPVRLLVGFQIPFLFPLIICSLLFVYWAAGYFVVEQIGAEDAYTGSNDYRVVLCAFWLIPCVCSSTKVFMFIFLFCSKHKLGAVYASEGIFVYLP